MIAYTRGWSASLGLLALLAACGASPARYENLRRQAFARETKPRLEALEPGSSVDWSNVRELTLETLLRHVQERNPTLAAMRSSWQAAVERYPQVTALGDPELGYMLAPGTIDSDESIYGQRIDLSQAFPWPGKLELRGEAALGDAAAAGEDFEAARLRLIHAATEAFYELQLVHRAIDLNRRNRKLVGELRRVAEARYGISLAGRGEAIQAEVEQEHLRHREIELERERMVLVAKLNTLLDVPPRSPLPPLPLRVPAPKEPPSFESLERAALESRPEIGSLGHAVQAREADVSLARRESYPDLAVNAGYDSLWEEVEKRAFVGLSINLPIQLDRRAAALEEARARQHEAESRLEAARAKVRFEVSAAYDDLVEQRHVVHLYDSSLLPAARENLAAARAGYAAASSDFATLITAERAVHRADLIRERALARYHQSLARLEHAVGKPLDELEVTP